MDDNFNTAIFQGIIKTIKRNSHNTDYKITGDDTLWINIYYRTKSSDAHCLIRLLSLITIYNDKIIIRRNFMLANLDKHTYNAEFQDRYKTDDEFWINKIIKIDNLTQELCNPRSLGNIIKFIKYFTNF